MHKTLNMLGLNKGGKEDSSMSKKNSTVNAKNSNKDNIDENKQINELDSLVKPNSPIPPKNIVKKSKDVRNTFKPDRRRSLRISNRSKNKYFAHMRPVSSSTEETTETNALTLSSPTNTLVHTVGATTYCKLTDLLSNEKLRNNVTVLDFLRNELKELKYIISNCIVARKTTKRKLNELLGQEIEDAKEIFKHIQQYCELKSNRNLSIVNQYMKKQPTVVTLYRLLYKPDTLASMLAHRYKQLINIRKERQNIINTKKVEAKKETDSNSQPIWEYTATSDMTTFLKSSIKEIELDLKDIKNNTLKTTPHSNTKGKKTSSGHYGEFRLECLDVKRVDMLKYLRKTQNNRLSIEAHEVRILKNVFNWKRKRNKIKSQAIDALSKAKNVSKVQFVKAVNECCKTLGRIYHSSDGEWISAEAAEDHIVRKAVTQIKAAQHRTILEENEKGEKLIANHKKQVEFELRDFRVGQAEECAIILQRDDTLIREIQAKDFAKAAVLWNGKTETKNSDIHGLREELMKLNNHLANVEKRSAKLFRDNQRRTIISSDIEAQACRRELLRLRLLGLLKRRNWLVNKLDHLKDIYQKQLYGESMDDNMCLHESISELDEVRDEMDGELKVLDDLIYRLCRRKIWLQDQLPSKDKHDFSKAELCMYSELSLLDQLDLPDDMLE